MESDDQAKSAPAAVPTPTLRTAAAEALLSGALLCADVERGARGVGQAVKPNMDRFLKALEALREALS